MDKRIIPDSELETVTGGRSSGRTLGVDVKIPLFNEDVTIKVYANGILQSSMTTTVDPSVRIKTFYFSGSKGIVSVKIKFNDTAVSYYNLDFNAGTVTEL